jgi:hypothetical protein
MPPSSLPRSAVSSWPPLPDSFRCLAR